MGSPRKPIFVRPKIRHLPPAGQGANWDTGAAAQNGRSWEVSSRKARRVGFCGVEARLASSRPAVRTQKDTPHEHWAIKCTAASRVRGSNGQLGLIRAMVR